MPELIQDFHHERIFGIHNLHYQGRTFKQFYCSKYFYKDLLINKHRFSKNGVSRSNKFFPITCLVYSSPSRLTVKRIVICRCWSGYSLNNYYWINEGPRCAVIVVSSDFQVLFIVFELKFYLRLI